MPRLVVIDKVVGVLRQMVVDRDAQHLAGRRLALFAPHDKQRVLQVHQVLVRIPIVGEFTVGKYGKLARPVRAVGDLHPPVLKPSAQRHEIGRFGSDVGILRLDLRIRRAVPAFRLVGV
jgi:hypothetical protein